MGNCWCASMGNNKEEMKFLFDEDIFLLTGHPIAKESRDAMNPEDSGAVHNSTDGADFSVDLLGAFPGKKTCLDLGTATGWMPLTMRRTGMLAVGLEGSDEPKKRGLGAWKEFPAIVRTCDIGKPFFVSDATGKEVIFDFIISWGTVEHIPFKNIAVLMENIRRHTDTDSIIMLNIDLTYVAADGYHQLWEHYPGSKEAIKWMLSDFFIIDEDLGSRSWRYSKMPDNKIRTYWWLRKKP